MWKSLNQSQKEKYLRMEDEDKSRYHREKQQWDADFQEILQLMQGRKGTLQPHILEPASGPDDAEPLDEDKEDDDDEEDVKLED